MDYTFHCTDFKKTKMRKCCQQIQYDIFECVNRFRKRPVICLEKCPRKLRKQANYGFVSFPKTVDCSLLPYIPVHLVIHLEHPLREFSFCIGDELFGHLTIKSVCHRAGNGAKRVGIAAQRDGQLESAVRVASSMHSSLLRAIKPAAETRMPLPLPKE